VLALLLAALLLLPRRLRGEDRLLYRYEDYVEDNDRIRVQTHSVWFEAELHSQLTLRGSYVNDALSGATPRGAPPDPANPDAAYVYIEDERGAGFVEAAWRWGRTLTTPQIAYSEESDYRSLGLSLTEAIEFNQRNTVLILGAARNSDEQRGLWQPTYRYKSNTDFLVGLNQLLGPRTVLNATVTLSFADGYLTDPYKGVNFSYDLPPFGPYDPANPNLDADPFTTNLGEKRPAHRFKQMLFVGLTQYFDRLHAGAEATYRLHHDDWGIVANTVQLTWNQKLGRRVTVSPLLRYHHQTEADFYTLRVNSDRDFAGSTVAFTQDNQFFALEGDGVFESEVLPNPDNYQIVSVPLPPDHYSSDYRLSELQSFTYGVSVLVTLNDHFTLNFGYKRYEMRGLDGRTAREFYPSAHVYTAGLNLTF
jgi:hypothetical protein